MGSPNDVEDTLDFPITGGPRETQNAPGLMDIVGVIPGGPVEPGAIEGDLRVLEQRQECVDDQRIGPPIRQNTSENVVEQSPAGGVQGSAAKGGGPRAHLAAPARPAEVEFEVLSQATIRMPRWAEPSQAPAAAFFHVEHIEAQQEHLFGRMGFREFRHRGPIAPEAEGFHEKLVARRFPADGFNALAGVFSLGAKAFEGASLEAQCEIGLNGENPASDLAGPAAQLEEGILLRQVFEIAREVGKQDDCLGAMPAGSRDIFGPWEKHGMENDMRKMRITLVSVGVPIGAPEMDLNITAHALALDEDFGTQEIGPSAAVPVAGMDDFNLRARSGGHRTADFTGGPETLDGPFANGEGTVRTVDFFNAFASAHLARYDNSACERESRRKPKGKPPNPLEGRP